MTAQPFSSSHKPSIAVIGAGLSGLTAAYRLEQAGFEVQVYEARQRPGGRVLSVKMGDHYDELGGSNFLNGGAAENSLALIHELNLETIRYEMIFSIVYSDGQHITTYAEILKKFKRPSDLWGEMEKAAAEARSLQDVIDGVFGSVPELRETLTLFMTTYEGSEPKNLDPSCIDSLFELFSVFKDRTKHDDGELDLMKVLVIKGGNAQLPIALSQKLKQPIHYGSVLTAIRHGEEKVILTFNKKQDVLADRVLLTIPCPAYHDIDIAPNMIPQDQLAHIKNIHYGTNAKILSPSGIKGQTLAFMAFPNFVGWWNEDDTIMTLYAGGQQGILDLHSAPSALAQGIALLKQYDESFVGDVPNIQQSQDSQFAFYPEAVFKNWVHDPYAKGSYSTRGIGKVAAFNEIITHHGEEVRALFRPVGDRIFFAGEHTTTLPILGTLESAIESGERMARLMMKALAEGDNR